MESDLRVLASAWHTDADLGRPIEVLTDMGKSRKLGFLDYQATGDSFLDLFSRLREERLNTILEHADWDSVAILAADLHRCWREGRIWRRSSTTG